MRCLSRDFPFTRLENIVFSVGHQVDFRTLAEFVAEQGVTCVSELNAFSKDCPSMEIIQQISRRHPGAQVCLS